MGLSGLLMLSEITSARKLRGITSMLPGIPVSRWRTLQTIRYPFFCKDENPNVATYPKGFPSGHTLWD